MAEEKEYDYSEYNSLCDSRESLEAQSDAYQNHINTLTANLEVLTASRDTLQSVKDNVKGIKSSINSAPDNSLSGWAGKNFEAVRIMSQEKDFATGYQSYIDRLDEVLDSLNNELTRVQNEIWEQEGFLGDIKSALNSLYNSIRNFFN